MTKNCVGISISGDEVSKEKIEFVEKVFSPKMEKGVEERSDDLANTIDCMEKFKELVMCLDNCQLTVSQFVEKSCELGIDMDSICGFYANNTSLSCFDSARKKIYDYVRRCSSGEILSLDEDEK